MGVSLADQVRNVEQENDALLSRVSTLETTNTILEMENARLVEQCDQLIRQNTDVRAMAEKLASDALDMLRAGRRENFKPAVDPYAPKHQTAQVEKGAVREVVELSYGEGAMSRHVDLRFAHKEVALEPIVLSAGLDEPLIAFAKSGAPPIITNTARAGESAETIAARKTPRGETMRSSDFLRRDSAFDVSFVEHANAEPRASVMG